LALRLVHTAQIARAEYSLVIEVVNGYSAQCTKQVLLINSRLKTETMDCI
jgi:hypothetical protein